MGEEYAGILQVDFKNRDLPSKFRRFVSVFLHCFGIIISSHCLKRLEANVSKLDIEKERKQKYLKILTFLGKVFDFAEKLNLSTFYIHGIFYHLSKRVTQIEYAKLRQTSIDFANVQNFGRTFKILGYLTMLNLVNQLEHIESWVQSGKAMSE